jgi:hypothetical protein
MDALDESRKIPCTYDYLSGSINPNMPKLPPFYRHMSAVSDLFQGRVISEVKCFHCHNISATHQPFFDLSLDLPKDAQLKRVTAERGQSAGNLEKQGVFGSFLSSIGITSAPISLSACLHAYCTSGTYFA